MFTTLSTVFTSVIGFVGEFITALTTESGALAGLQELFLLGVAIALISFCVGLARRIIWGA